MVAQRARDGSLKALPWQEGKDLPHQDGDESKGSDRCQVANDIG